MLCLLVHGDLKLKSSSVGDNSLHIFNSTTSIRRHATALSSVYGNNSILSSLSMSVSLAKYGTMSVAELHRLLILSLASSSFRCTYKVKPV